MGDVLRALAEYRNTHVHGCPWLYACGTRRNCAITEFKSSPACPLIGKLKQNMIYTYNEVLLRLENDGNSDLCYSLDEP